MWIMTNFCNLILNVDNDEDRQDTNDHAMVNDQANNGNDDMSVLDVQTERRADLDRGMAQNPKERLWLDVLKQEGNGPSI